MLACPKEEPGKSVSEHTHSAVTGRVLGNATAHSTEPDCDQQHRQRGNMSDIPVKGRGPVSQKKKEKVPKV